MFKKLFFGLVAALLVSGAFAQTTHQVFYPFNNPIASQPRFPTALAACTYFVNSIWGIPGAATAVLAYGITYNCFDSSGGNRGQAEGSNVTLSCTGGTVPKFTGSGPSATWTCETTACPVGQGKTVNVTDGWARSPNADADDYVFDYGLIPVDGDFNDGVCVGTIGRVERCYRSQVPAANGLYRTSCDYPFLFTGESTSPGNANADPDTPPPACPGFVGTVNDKPVCVGTSTSPLPAPSPAPNVPTVAGNPSSGQQPSTGPGAGSGGPGRTPLVGSGGNDGGPSSAAIGPSGSGPRGEPGEDGTAVCGAPPLPACNVKLDETGVPAEGTASGRFTQGNTDVDAVRTDAQGAINDARDGDLPGWTWTFSLPSACSPYPLEAFGFDIDVCQFQPIIHDLMSMLWLAAGVFGLVSLFRNTVGA